MQRRGYAHPRNDGKRDNTEGLVPKLGAVDIHRSKQRALDTQYAQAVPTLIISTMMLVHYPGIYQFAGVHLPNFYTQPPLDTPQRRPLDLPALDVDACTQPPIVSAVKTRSACNCEERGGAQGRGAHGLLRCPPRSPRAAQAAEEIHCNARRGRLRRVPRAGACTRAYSSSASTSALARNARAPKVVRSLGTWPSPCSVHAFPARLHLIPRYNFPRRRVPRRA
ncbi:hypothetical protein DFH09DRAFT_1173992 [Mycena vulgaris]|nr:hypothetical protein DFH09DRAFT_1173992 [Mycena vulgaris]